MSCPSTAGICALAPFYFGALGDIGAEAKSATAALQEATQDQDPNVADAAKAALAKIQG